MDNLSSINSLQLVAQPLQDSELTWSPDEYAGGESMLSFPDLFF